MNLSELNWKTWGLVMILALGATVEIIKRIPSGRSAWDAGLRAITETTDQPYSIRRSRVAMMEGRNAPAMLPASRPAPIRSMPTAATTPPPMTQDQLAALVAKQNEKKLEQSTDGWEVVIDPKTGKKVKRKKKKKKKIVKKDKTEQAPTLAEQTQQNDSDWDTDSSEAAIDNAISYSVQTGELAPPPPKKEDSPFESAEEWIRRLLARPNLTETNRFIDHFKRNLVTADVYYKVIRMMIEDSRPEMKKLGILAASQVFTPMSFQILGKVLQSNADATVKEKAEEALKAYEVFARLSVLEKILSASSSGFNTILATQKLQASAEANLKTATATNNGTAAPTEVVRIRQITAYKKFVPILTNLSQSQDQAVKDQATQTLSALQSLLGSTTASSPADPQPAS